MASWLSHPVLSYGEAVEAVIVALGKSLDYRKCTWCDYPAHFHDPEKLKNRMEKEIARLDPEYSEDFWVVGIPDIKLIIRDLSHLAFRIDLYYVASDGETAIWGKLLPEADRFEVPLVLLDRLVPSMARGELTPEGAEITERAPGYATYHVNGSDREWRIPDAFVGFISALAKLKLGFEGLLDPWTRKVLEKTPRELPSPVAPALPDQPTPSHEDVAQALSGLGYKKQEIAQAMQSIRFTPGATLEERVRQVLEYLGKS